MRDDCVFKHESGEGAGLEAGKLLYYDLGYYNTLLSLGRSGHCYLSVSIPTVTLTLTVRVTDAVHLA